MRFKKVLVGIDSSGNLEYSMITCGPETDVNRFYSSMEKIFNSYRARILHFADISKSIRSIASKDFLDLITNARQISFTKVIHKKPSGVVHRKYYLNDVPKCFASSLESLSKKHRIIEIHVHDDYGIKGVKNSNDAFMKSIVEQLTKTISPRDKGMKIWKKHGFWYSSVKTDDGKQIKIKSSKFSRNDSKPIVISDMVLGYSRLCSGYLCKQKKKVHTKVV